MQNTNIKKTIYVCQKCGYKSGKWLGKCPSCESWNPFTEEIVQPAVEEKIFTLSAQEEARPIREVELEKMPRYQAKSEELNRVMGGGIIPGSVTLIAGDPGIGKSSLTLELSADLARQGKKVLYVSGEESSQQLRMRAERLNALAQGLYVCAETNFERISAQVERIKPAFMVVDSIQTIYRSIMESVPGSISQIRESAAGFMRLAKAKAIAIFIIGHVTKDGGLAGPRVLEHIVDTVLFFEGENTADLRVLRVMKNRFGATSEIGLFEMSEGGLVDVEDASKHFLPDKAQEIGSVITPTVEGTRPLLVEVQSLVAPTPYAPPRRTSDSIDFKRIQLLIAVLERRIRLNIGQCDVYVKTSGGIKIVEPAADLAITVAMASSYANRKLLPKCVIFGEVGLNGEVRAVSKARTRVDEARRMGFNAVVLPRKNAAELKGEFEGVRLIAVETVQEALSAAMPN